MTLLNTPITEVIDQLLASLQQQAFYHDYVVRGSYVSRHYMYDYARPCHDLDLLYLGDYQPQLWLEQLQLLIQQSVLQVDLEQVEAQAIWEDSISQGMRYKLPITYQNQTLELQIDIACNDPLASPPVELTHNGFKVKTVTLETLAAWKLHGLFEHLNGPWTSKTLWDLYVFCRYNPLDKDQFRQATELAFSSRLDPIEIINRLLWGDFASSKKSARYWRKEFPSFCQCELVELETVIHWLQNYLPQCFQFETQVPLLTLSDIIRYRATQLRQLGTPEAKKKLSTLKQKNKVLPHKAYNTINHIPSSRLGPSERCITAYQFKQLTEVSDENHIIVVQEKLDGSCVCAYRENDEIFALGRAGDLADSSPNESRRLWADWVYQHQDRFMQVLNNGERLCGEWLAMVHGTHYQLSHEPFVAFDLFDANNHALTYQSFIERIQTANFTTPHLIHYGSPISLEQALEQLSSGHHDSIDMPEGLIWRLETKDRIKFKAKYVRSDKEDGCYLTEKTGKPEIWNWRPEKEEP